LAERCVLSMSKVGDLVLDPYMGVGTTAAAALLNSRRSAGAESSAEYYRLGIERVMLARNGTLRTRPRHRAVYVPNPDSKLLLRNDATSKSQEPQSTPVKL
jgi:adenine-specific DNA-methyltransferase